LVSLFPIVRKMVEKFLVLI